jgi:hypothetical protein
MDAMDKLVRRVTVVQGSGENRHSNVVYKSDEDEDFDDATEPLIPFKRIERGVTRLLKAQVVAAQDAYQRHLGSVEKGGGSWLYDAPGNFMKTEWKALKEIRKAAGIPRVKFDEDEDEGD